MTGEEVAARAGGPAGRAQSGRWRRFLRATAAVVTLALGMPALLCAPAQAGWLATLGGELSFSAGVVSGDNEDLARTVTVTQSDPSHVVIASTGENIVTLDQRVIDHCLYVNPPTHDAVICDLTAMQIATLDVITGNGDDHITVDTPLSTVLCGGPGDDVLVGSRGVDILQGAAGNDALSGGAGDDFLRADRATLSATVPNCSAPAADPPGVNTLDGGVGEDLLVSDDGPDTLRGGPDDDILFGRPGNDELHGDDGADVMIGQDDADTLDGGPGRDVISGGAGPDRLDGGPDPDELGLPILLTVDEGGPIETSIETGDDQYFGGTGDDTLFAGPGERTLNYGLQTPQRAPGRAQTNGADLFSGGEGNDHVSYINREIPVSVTLDGNANDGTGGEGDNVAGDVERITGSAVDDVLSGGSGSEMLDGGPGSDTLAGLASADTLEGGDGDGGADNVSGGDGPDTLSGGPGGDALSGGDDADVLRGGGGTDRLSGDAGDDQVQGEADADQLSGGPGADVLDGGAGVDRVDYSDTTAAVSVSLDERRNDGVGGEDWVQRVEDVLGGPGPDTLVGNAAANALGGGAGDDLIVGGAGQDALSGGAGVDIVRARDGGRDTIACGTGQDLALADELDTLPAGLERCERADTGGPARRGEVLLRPDGCRLENVRLPAMARAFGLEESLSVPRLTAIDANRCAALLSTRRREPRARAVGGSLLVRRPGTRHGPLVLSLDRSSFAACPRAPASRVVRRLTVQAHGRVRVVGRRSVVTARAATWTITDRCASTETRVRRGIVRVGDAGRRRAVTVTAGHRHISTSKRAR